MTLIYVGTYNIDMTLLDIIEAHCYVVDSSELILMSIYIANSIQQLTAGRFGHIGLRHLRTKVLRR